MNDYYGRPIFRGRPTMTYGQYILREVLDPNHEVWNGAVQAEKVLRASNNGEYSIDHIRRIEQDVKAMRSIYKIDPLLAEEASCYINF